MSGQPFNCSVRSPQRASASAAAPPWPDGSGAQGGAGPAAGGRPSWQLSTQRQQRHLHALPLPQHPGTGGLPATSTRSPLPPHPGTGGLPATSTRSPFPRILVPGTGGLPATSTPSPFPRIPVPGTGGLPATSTRSPFPHILVPLTGGLPATSTRSPFPRIQVLGTGGLPGAHSAGPAYLLHEHVDVSLRRVQHVAVGVLQPLDRDVHGLAVYVYPPSRPGGQEQPETGRRMSAKVARPGIPRGSSGEDSLLLQQGV